MKIRCPRRLVGDGGADGFVDVVSAGPFAAPRARGLEHAGVGSSFEHLESFDVATPVPAPKIERRAGRSRPNFGTLEPRRVEVDSADLGTNAHVEVGSKIRKFRPRLVHDPLAHASLYGAKFAAPRFLLFYDDASQARGEAFARDRAGAWAHHAWDADRGPSSCDARGSGDLAVAFGDGREEALL